MARPRKSEAIDIPGRAVEETIRLLDEADPEALTMVRVAEAVGCSAPALYNHFRNRNALLRAVHDEGFRRLYQEKLAVAARTDGDAFARLREGGRAYLRFARENPALYRLMFMPPPQEELDNPFEGDVGRRALGFLRDSVESIQREGWLPGQDAACVAFVLWSSVHGAASLVAQGRAPGAAAEVERLPERTVDLLMALIEATRTAPAGLPPPPPG